ncbi:hypothetical protein BCR34DRAFT_586437 [Clohesyomyces aquaticus]|uniref:Uncharacterized protein n=1 Tax=Clohesyomyces aquaticus TaxID=1231657 RepID=A0A1Y1ZT96_9PLEO|nr:hypothetical protein BCR34DRAFT_586437 [Clohesyomyces aquaticus]
MSVQGLGKRRAAKVRPGVTCTPPMPRTTFIRPCPKGSPLAAAVQEPWSRFGHGLRVSPSPAGGRPQRARAGAGAAAADSTPSASRDVRGSLGWYSGACRFTHCLSHRGNEDTESIRGREIVTAAEPRARSLAAPCYRALGGRLYTGRQGKPPETTY